MWLASQGQTATAIAQSTGFTRGWVGQVVKRYNEWGPGGWGMADRRRTHSRRQAPALSAEQQAELLAAVEGPPPRGELWQRTLDGTTGRRVDGRTARPPDPAPTRLGVSRTPERQAADPAAAPRACRRRPCPRRRLPRCLPPGAGRTLGHGLLDEHRIGLKPILKKVWCFGGKRPLAPAQHRYEWRYLVGFVHPASGRTLWHLATFVPIPLLYGMEYLGRQR